MLTVETLMFIHNNMWLLTYEEVQQLHQVLVTEWTFDNPSAQVSVLVAEAASLCRQRQMERNNERDQRITDPDRVILRGEPNTSDISGWERMASILESHGVTISQLKDYPRERVRRQ